MTLLVVCPGCGGKDYDMSTAQGCVEQALHEGGGGQKIKSIDGDAPMMTVNVVFPIVSKYDTTKTVMNVTSAHICKNLFANSKYKNPPDKVAICFWADVVEKKTGKDSQIVVYSMIINRKDTAGINWDKVDAIDITKSAKDGHADERPMLKKLCK